MHTKTRKFIFIQFRKGGREGGMQKGKAKHITNNRRGAFSYRLVRRDEGNNGMNFTKLFFFSKSLFKYIFFFFCLHVNVSNVLYSWNKNLGILITFFSLIFFFTILYSRLPWFAASHWIRVPLFRNGTSFSPPRSSFATPPPPLLLLCDDDLNVVDNLK